MSACSSSALAAAKAPMLRKGSPMVTLDAAQHRDLVRSVQSQVPGISQEDAEDAVQEAWIVLAQKAHTLDPGPVGGFLMRTARFKAMNMRTRAQRTLSLDALAEAAGDGVDAFADRHLGTSLDTHLELAELADDPIASRALEAAKRGASGRIAPRGMNHPCARYTDEQVAKVRELRAEGLAPRAIEQLTGVPAGYCTALARRASRLCETSEGWTKEMVVDAISRFYRRAGRVPVFHDARKNPAMPSTATARRLFGGWSDAVRAAGLEPAYGHRRQRAWTENEMIEAFCAWRLLNSRWPSGHDLKQDPSLPSPATTMRRLGASGAPSISRVVLGRLA